MEDEEGGDEFEAGFKVKRVNKDTDTTKFVSFWKSSSKILIKNHTGNTLFSVIAKFYDENCNCKCILSDSNSQELELWQISQKALKSLFFETC